MEAVGETRGVVLHERPAAVGRLVEEDVHFARVHLGVLADAHHAHRVTGPHAVVVGQEEVRAQAASPRAHVVQEPRQRLAAEAPEGRPQRQVRLVRRQPHLIELRAAQEALADGVGILRAQELAELLLALAAIAPVVARPVKEHAVRAVLHVHLDDALHVGAAGGLVRTPVEALLFAIDIRDRRAVGLELRPGERVGGARPQVVLVVAPSLVVEVEDERALLRVAVPHVRGDVRDGVDAGLLQGVGALLEALHLALELRALGQAVVCPAAGRAVQMREVDVIAEDDLLVARAADGVAELAETQVEGLGVERGGEQEESDEHQDAHGMSPVLWRTGPPACAGGPEVTALTACQLEAGAPTATASHPLPPP